MTQKIAAVFSDECDIAATAATIEASMSNWLDEKAPVPDAAESAAAESAAAESTAAAEPAAAEQPVPSSTAVAVPSKVEYTAEERATRIKELEEREQGWIGPEHLTHWKATFVPNDKIGLMSRKQRPNTSAKKTPGSEANAFPRGPHIRHFVINTLPSDDGESFLRT
eukprot:5634490-Prymnesium_polylepis.1